MCRDVLVPLDEADLIPWPYLGRRWLTRHRGRGMPEHHASGRAVPAAQGAISSALVPCRDPVSRGVTVITKDDAILPWAVPIWYTLG
jgi:hypothetical protein